MKLIFISILAILCASLVNAAPIVHTVFFTLKSESNTLDTQAFKKRSLELANIQGVEDFAWVEEVSPKNDFQCGLTMQFADQSAYDYYNNHPKHVDYVNNV